MNVINDDDVQLLHASISCIAEILPFRPLCTQLAYPFYDTKCDRYVCLIFDVGSFLYQPFIQITAYVGTGKDLLRYSYQALPRMVRAWVGIVFTHFFYNILM